MGGDKRNIFFKRNRAERKVMDEEFEVDANINIDIEEEKAVDTDEYVAEEYMETAELATEKEDNEVHLKLLEELLSEKPLTEKADAKSISKPPKLLGIIDEDMLLLGVAAVVLQSPRKDFTLLPLMLLLMTNKQG